jgi:hypothetical protein
MNTLNSYLVTVAIMHLELFRLKYMLKGTITYIGLVQAIWLKHSDVQRNVEQIAIGNRPSRQ